jgi:hypothetical protein
MDGEGFVLSVGQAGERPLQIKNMRFPQPVEAGWTSGCSSPRFAKHCQFIGQKSTIRATAHPGGRLPRVFRTGVVYLLCNFEEGFDV